MLTIPPCLLPFIEHIRSLEASSQPSIPYSLTPWLKYFPSDPDFLAVTRCFPTRITRPDIVDLAREAHHRPNPASVRRVFFACMLWGFGIIGYGAYRTAAMLSTPHADHLLCQVFARLSCGDLQTAYTSFHLHRCGPAFFTKFFYFAGLGCRLDPLPLILDSRVARSLEHLCGRNLLNLQATRDASGQITYIERDWPAYYRYIRLMNTWARDLGCPPDSLELFLFDPPLEFSSG